MSQTELLLTAPTPREFGPHTRTRRSDPDTSRGAAESLDVNRSQGSVLFVLRSCGPLTQSVMVDTLAGELSPSRVRTACAELVELGLVEDSGKRVRLPSGRNAIVWKAK